jgi:hypothetical protein
MFVNIEGSRPGLVQGLLRLGRLWPDQVLLGCTRERLRIGLHDVAQLPYGLFLLVHGPIHSSY